MKPTQQQNEILEAVKKYRSVKINAFAGTGKTSTLQLIANKYKTKKILYLAFNSSIKNEAIGLFPNNTSVKTTHGLAFGAIKKHTNIDLTSIVNYRAIDISKEFTITYNQAIGTLKIFDSFCNSSMSEISKDDIEHKTAQNMFNRMLINKLKPTHGFYLKYYHLLISTQQIPQYAYDIVMLDEAQDTNEVTLGIFESINAKTKIYVGDEHQQIYSFRGSKNALDKIQTEKKLYLSCSFRFNEVIAEYANILLKNFKNEKVEIDTISKSSATIESNGYISRTNATLIAIIGKRIEDRKPFVTIRNPNEIFNLTIEVYHLLNNQKSKIIRNRFLKDFEDEDDVLEYANEVEDYELKSALKVSKEYGDKIFGFKEISDKFYTAWQNRINNGFDRRIKEILFLTTAHTSKGLEWDRVTIADDFTDFADIIVDLNCDSLKEFQDGMDTLQNQELFDEFNLFYVAITRAKKEIIKDSENFHYLMANNLYKLIDNRIKETKHDIANIQNNKDNGKSKKIASKMKSEDKQQLRQGRNARDGKAKNSGLKWSLEDKIKAKSMFNKNNTIYQISNKLERTEGAILGELLKSEIISKADQVKLLSMVNTNSSNATKRILSV